MKRLNPRQSLHVTVIAPISNQCCAWSDRELSGNIIGKSENMVRISTKGRSDSIGDRAGHARQENNQDQSKFSIKNLLNSHTKQVNHQAVIPHDFFNFYNQGTGERRRDQDWESKRHCKAPNRRAMETRMRTHALEGTMTAEDMDRDRKGKAAVKEEDMVEIWEIFDDSEEDFEK